MVAPSADRVEQNSPESANEQIRRRTEMSIAYYAANPGQIDQRLAELDREWDVERALETAASSFTVAGMALGVLRGRKWFLLPLVVGGFLLQHAIQGWCPPLEVIRRLGFRTRAEIDQERYALKAIRGDFREVQGLDDGGQVIRKAVEATRK